MKERLGGNLPEERGTEIHEDHVATNNWDEMIRRAKAEREEDAVFNTYRIRNTGEVDPSTPFS